MLRTIGLLTALSVGASASLLMAFSPSALAQTAVSETDKQQVELAVGTVYQWEGQYEKTVDGLIEATKGFPSFWSGRDNKDTELERIDRVRTLLLQNRSAILEKAGGDLLATVDPVSLVDHLERITEGTMTPQDEEMIEQVHRSYRDAIFNAMSSYGVQANEEFEGR